jgi:hypothetical protein
MIWGMTSLLRDADRFRRQAYETVEIVRALPFPVEGDELVPFGGRSVPKSAKSVPRRFEAPDCAESLSRWS